jgi:hypothetical protein
VTDEAKPDPFHGKRAPGDLDRLLEGQKKARAQAARVEEAALNDRPIDLYRELQADAAKAALRAYRKYNQTGKLDPKLTEVSREARQLTDRLIELIDREGVAAHAEAFFAEVFGRVESFAPGMAELAKPLVATDSG